VPGCLRAGRPGVVVRLRRASFGAKDRFLRAAPRRLDRALGALGIEHDIKVYPDAGNAFLSQSEDEPGMVAGTLAQVTHAGYHEASAQDARRRIIAFFDAHLKARRRSHAATGTAGITRKVRKTGQCLTTMGRSARLPRALGEGGPAAHRVLLRPHRRCAVGE
jgi:hypothetical protein